MTNISSWLHRLWTPSKPKHKRPSCSQQAKTFTKSNRLINFPSCIVSQWCNRENNINSLVISLLGALPNTSSTDKHFLCSNHPGESSKCGNFQITWGANEPIYIEGNHSSWTHMHTSGQSKIMDISKMMKLRLYHKLKK